MNNRIKLPTVLQYEAVECGAASLKIVLEYFGKIIPLTEVRTACGVSRDGVSALDIKKAAITYDLDVRGYRCGADELYRSVNKPAILFWNFNHFLVLEGFDDDFAYLSDPAMGRRKVTKELFKTSFTGVVLELKPTDKFQKIGKKDILYANLYRLLSTYKKQLILLSVFGCLAAIPEIFVAGATSQFIDSYLQDERQNIGIPIVWISLISIFLLVVVNVVIKNVLRSTTVLASKRGASMSFVSLFSLPYTYFQQRLPGELADRLSLPVELVGISLGSIFSYFLDIATGIGALVAAALISPFLMVFIVLVSLINAFVAIRVREMRKDANFRLYEVAGKAYGVSTSTIQSIESVKACAIENENFIAWSARFNEFIEELQKQSFVSGIVELVSTTSTFIISTFTILIGGLLVISGRISLGDLIAVTLLSSLISKPLSQLGYLTFNFQNLDGESGRFNDVVDSKIDNTIRSFFLPSQELKTDLDLRLSGNIKLEKLQFQFSRTKPMMFGSLNFDIASGSHLALIGKSGSGKSTLLKLMCGLMHQTSGKILFDGKSISDINDRLLRQSLALVSQEPFVFRGTIFDNLTLWDSDIDRGECVDVLEEVGLLQEFGGSTCLSKESTEGGRNISGGQRQRLEIARALLRKPSILFMDEGTSALDDKREKSILNCIKKRNCTLITVAHRLYSADVSDNIIILNRGQIEEMGSTATIINNPNSLYQNFSSSE